MRDDHTGHGHGGTTLRPETTGQAIRALIAAPPARNREDATRCAITAVIDLVTRAAKGDKRAWDALVERYIPLIWSICREYRLDGADADNTGQASGCSS